MSIVLVGFQGGPKVSKEALDKENELDTHLEKRIKRKLLCSLMMVKSICLFCCKINLLSKNIRDTRWSSKPLDHHCSVAACMLKLGLFIEK